MAASKTKAVVRRKSGHKPAGQARAGRVAAALGTPLAAESLSAMLPSGLPPEIEPILAASYNAVIESRKTKRRVRFVVTVGPRGAPEITPIEVERDEARSSENDLGVALEAARSRGRVKVSEILSGQEMLSADQFAALIGVSRMTVNAKRQKRQVLGLEGAKRGFRFPAWQIGEDGKPFAALPELFDRLGGSPWTVYRFLIQHHPELDGSTGCEALQTGETNKVINAAESVARAFS